MLNEPVVPLYDLVTSLSKAIDLVNPAISGHQERVAYIAFSIAEEYGPAPSNLNEIVLAGSLHDCGAISLRERLETFQFEYMSGQKHAEIASSLLRCFLPLASVANLVRFHHMHWENGSGTEFNNKEVPIESHILHIADRIDVLIDRKSEILGQRKGIVERISEGKGTMFKPDLVDIFKTLSRKESFWLDVTSPSVSFILSRKVKLPTIQLGLKSLLDLATLFSHIIDFRSRFTATHSSGIAVVSEALARYAGFADKESKMMRVAGLLHDLGKLAVPAEILEKPGKLTLDELNIIRSHTYYTYRTLEPISALETINEWASFHHERLDGNGYPFHLKDDELSLGARIMAVSDVFTALTEDRPYRTGLTKHDALKTIFKMRDNLALDGYIVSLLECHFDEINDLREDTQKRAREDYERFIVSS